MDLARQQPDEQQLLCAAGQKSGLAVGLEKLAPESDELDQVGMVEVR